MSNLFYSRVITAANSMRAHKIFFLGWAMRGSKGQKFTPSSMEKKSPSGGLREKPFSQN